MAVPPAPEQLARCPSSLNGIPCTVRTIRETQFRVRRFWLDGDNSDVSESLGTDYISAQNSLGQKYECDTTECQNNRAAAEARKRAEEVSQDAKEPTKTSVGQPSIPTNITQPATIGSPTGQMRPPQGSRSSSRAATVGSASAPSKRRKRTRFCC